ncbi:MAG TPA: c-type cytochrome [Oscillatoriaceae cyanobacterium]
MPRLRFSWLAATLGLVMLGGCSLFHASSAAAPDIQVPRTPARIARGAYLANHVMACVACHSPLTAQGAPQPGLLGAGGRLFGKKNGLPGNIYSSNLTPDMATGLGNWTDGEILRAMREGVAKDGTALFPVMPYPNYAKMSDDDAEAIVAYLRTLKPVKHALPARTLDFPVNLFVNTIPKPLDRPVPPPPTESVAHGHYLLTMASCSECHTPRSGPSVDMSRYLAGGFAFGDEDSVYQMPNITQNKQLGIGGWSDAQIEAAVRYGQTPSGRQLAPAMPWPYYNGLSNRDMHDLIAYLRTVPAVPPNPAR